MIFNGKLNKLLTLIRSASDEQKIDELTLDIEAQIESNAMRVKKDLDIVRKDADPEMTR